jgi:hypothetical protein
LEWIKIGSIAFFSPGFALKWDLKHVTCTDHRVLVENETHTKSKNHIVVDSHMYPAMMKRKLTNDPVEFFRVLPHGIKLKIYRFTVHVFDSRQQLIKAVDLYVKTRYARPRGTAPRWPRHHPIGKWDVAGVTDFSDVFSRSRIGSTERFNEDLSLLLNISTVSETGNEPASSPAPESERRPQRADQASPHNSCTQATATLATPGTTMIFGTGDGAPHE